MDDLSFEFTTAASEIKGISDVKIFPNPFSDFFTIDLNVKTKGQLDLLDVNGKIVVSKKLNVGAHLLEFDLRGIPAGSYFLYWKGEDGKIQILEKLVKTK